MPGIMDLPCLLTMSLGMRFRGQYHGKRTESKERSEEEADEDQEGKKGRQGREEALDLICDSDPVA